MFEKRDEKSGALLFYLNSTEMELLQIKNKYNELVVVKDNYEKLQEKVERLEKLLLGE